MADNQQTIPPEIKAQATEQLMPALDRFEAQAQLKFRNKKALAGFVADELMTLAASNPSAMTDRQIVANVFMKVIKEHEPEAFNKIEALENNMALKPAAMAKSASPAQTAAAPFPYSSPSQAMPTTTPEEAELKLNYATDNNAAKFQLNLIREERNKKSGAPGNDFFPGIANVDHDTAQKTVDAVAKSTKEEPGFFGSIGVYIAALFKYVFSGFQGNFSEMVEEGKLKPVAQAARKNFIDAGLTGATADLWSGVDANGNIVKKDGKTTGVYAVHEGKFHPDLAQARRDANLGQQNSEKQGKYVNDTIDKFLTDIRKDNPEQHKQLMKLLAQRDNDGIPVIDRTEGKQIIEQMSQQVLNNINQFEYNSLGRQKFGDEGLQEKIKAHITTVVGTKIRAELGSSAAGFEATQADHDNKAPSFVGTPPAKATEPSKSNQAAALAP